MTHYGVDVSSNNPHPINYNRVASSLRLKGSGAQPFAFVKITESTTYINPFWRKDVNGFVAAGMAVAGYIFDHGLANPVAEENKARLVVGPGLPLIVDAEDPQGLSPGQYRDHIVQVIGHEPVKMEYLNQSQVRSGELTPGVWLWLADYNPGPWPFHPKLVQYTDRAIVNGIGGATDGDVWTGLETEFLLFFHNAQAPGFHSVLRLGSTGDEVSVLQLALNRTTLTPKLAVDGFFGTKTDAAVRVFQLTHHLVVDGIVGAITWKALGV